VEFRDLNEAISGWHRADIIAAVRKRGASLSEIGRRVGLSRKSMSWALIRRHERANLAIAEFLGVPPHDLWPQWFLPTIPTPAPEPTPARRRSSPPSKKAA
jgi:Ner family transcriptional regulator